MKKIKIAIAGIGAVGGYYGGLLASHYQKSENVDIFFIARGESLQALKENGIRIKRSFNNIIAKPTLATDDPSEIGVVDYLFCCTKSYKWEANFQNLAPAIGPDTVVIPLVNGIEIFEQIQKTLPHNKVWKGCVYIGAHLLAPGYVEKYTLKDQLIFGLNDQDKERQKELQALLANARVQATNPDNIDIEIWKKFFMVSTMSTITSYFNETIYEVRNKHMDLYITLGYELLSLIQAKGINLPKDIVYSSVKLQLVLPTSATTSMHRDFLTGGPTEIKILTEYVLREADKLNLDLPTYRFMYQALTQFPYPV